MPQWNSLITVLSEITRKNCEALVCCPHRGVVSTAIPGGAAAWNATDNLLKKPIKTFVKSQNSSTNTKVVKTKKTARLFRSELIRLLADF